MKPNITFNMKQMKDYIRSNKLNHPDLKLSMKRDDMITGLKKAGHWEEVKSKSQSVKSKVKAIEKKLTPKPETKPPVKKEAPRGRRKIVASMKKGTYSVMGEFVLDFPGGEHELNKYTKKDIPLLKITGFSDDGYSFVGDFWEYKIVDTNTGILLKGVEMNRAEPTKPTGKSGMVGYYQKYRGKVLKSNVPGDMIK